MTAAIFFDLDGTLTDPGVGIFRSIRHALDCLDVECPGDEELARYIGPPLLGSFEKLVGSEAAPRALALYRERFAERGWKENHVYPGIVEALQELVESGNTLYLATSKPLVYAERIIEHFGLARFFTRLFGSELDGTRSDKSELLRFALTRIQAAARISMVGDREHDIVGARANELAAIGVSYGYGTREALQAAGADVIVDNPRQLVPTLR